MSVAERLKKLQRDHTKCLLGRLEELIPPEFTSKAAAQRSAGKRYTSLSVCRKTRAGMLCLFVCASVCRASASRAMAV